MLNYIWLNTDSGKISVLVLLDLSAAFDMEDHIMLRGKLENWVGLSRAVLNWSYLEGWRYFVTIGSYESDRMAMMYEVPQGSVVGPLLFNLNMLALGQILQNNNIDYHG